MSKRQDAYDAYYRQYIGRHQRESRVRYALVIALVAIAFLLGSMNWANVVRQGAAKLNIPEFVLPKENQKEK